MCTPHPHLSGREGGGGPRGSPFGPQAWGVSCPLLSVSTPSCLGSGPQMSCSTVGSNKASQPCVWAISKFPTCPDHPQPRPISQQCPGLGHRVRTTKTGQKGRERPWVLVMAPHSHLHSLCMLGISPLS